MNQMDLMPLARSSDPITSHEAAESAVELMARHQALIVACLIKHGPAGKDRVAALTALNGVQVCRRLCELERTGLIEPTGRTVKSTSGRNEREWRLCGGAH